MNFIFPRWAFNTRNTFGHHCSVFTKRFVLWVGRAFFICCSLGEFEVRWNVVFGIFIYPSNGIRKWWYYKQPGP